MKASIEVRDRKEADLIRRGLANNEVRALVTVMGALSQCQDDDARRRAMYWVQDKLEQEEFEARSATNKVTRA